MGAPTINGQGLSAFQESMAFVVPVVVVGVVPSPYTLNIGASIIRIGFWGFLVIIIV